MSDIDLFLLIRILCFSILGAGLLLALLVGIGCVSCGSPPQESSNDPEPAVPNETSDPINVLDNNLSLFGLAYDIESFEATTFSQMQQQQEYRTQIINNHTTDEDLSMDEIQAEVDRYRLIRSKLHYQIVLPDRSNVNIESLRGVGDAKEEDATSTIEDDGDDTTSSIGSDHFKEEQSTSSSSMLSLYHRVQGLFSIRSLRPRKKDICSVCLEGFQPGQTICAAKNSCCSHMFHEDCIRTWLKKNDDCPLCRSNMMQ